MRHAWGWTRAALLVTALCGGPWGCGGSGPGPQAPPPTARMPNVLFIPVDDLNGWISALGTHPGVQTPNIDRLAARGVLFRSAHAPAPECLPSRVSVLTSRRPSSSGVYLNEQLSWRPLLPDAVTLPQHFRGSGYVTAGAGTVFHGPRYNDAASWDQFLERPQDPLPPGRPLNGIRGAAQFDWGPLDVPDDAMADAQVVRYASDFLRQPRDRPFFLAVGIGKPHLPWYVPRAYFDRHPLGGITLPAVDPNDLDDVPPIGRELAERLDDHDRVLAAGQWPSAVQGYLASISFADAMIGRLLDALEASGHTNDTMVVLWGDNGMHLGEKQHWRKFTLWEESTRVPLIVVAPGQTRAGSVCDRVVSLLDLYPTVAELAGLPPRAGLEGVSMARLVRDPSSAWDRPALTTFGRGNHTVRTATHRYVQYHDGTEELYDRTLDPREWSNIAADPRAQATKSALRDLLPTLNADGPTAPEDLDD